MKKLMILITIAALGDVTKTGVFALEWISSSLFPNGTVVQACVGDNVKLPWLFHMSPGKELSIDWSKTSKDQDERLDLARYSGYTFYELGSHRYLTFLPNAGLMLPNVSLSDTGYYKVAVNLTEDSQSYEQVAFLQVSDAPVELKAFIILESANSTNGPWNVQLGCRHQDTGGQPAPSVIWTTPSNRRVISTSYNSNTNTFILELPLPMEQGDYSCSLNSSGPAVNCLNTRRAATVSVKGAIESMVQSNNDNIKAMVQSNNDNTTPMIQSNNDNTTPMIQSNNDNKTAMIQSNYDNIAALVKKKFDNITTLVQSKFDSITAMVQSKFDNITTLVQSNNNNSKAMVPSNNGNITALAQSKLDNINAVILQLHSGFLQILGPDYVHRPASCVDVQRYDNVSGIHKLIVNGDRPVRVFCDQSTDKGGWTVIQRRRDGAVTFLRNWQQYEMGFGDLNGDFWIGLANLYHLTKNKNSKLRIELTINIGKPVNYFAMYNTFSISGAQDYYRLNVSEYNGTSGDFFTFHNNMKFSTFDQDHDNLTAGNCAQINQGAWWYSNCVYFNLNGPYETSRVIGITSKKRNGDKLLITRVEMKIK